MPAAKKEKVDGNGKMLAELTLVCKWYNFQHQYQAGGSETDEIK
jgi:hypothetical protein